MTFYIRALSADRSSNSCFNYYFFQFLKSLHNWLYVHMYAGTVSQEGTEAEKATDFQKLYYKPRNISIYLSFLKL